MLTVIIKNTNNKVCSLRSLIISLFDYFTYYFTYYFYFFSTQVIGLTHVIFKSMKNQLLLGKH